MKYKSWLILISIWMLLIGGYVTSRYYQIKRNVSPSMKETLWLVKVGDRNIKRGDYIVAKFHDFRMQDPYDYEFIVKQIGGMAGDHIYVTKQMGVIKQLPVPNKYSWIYTVNNESYPVFNYLGMHKFTPLTTTDLVIPQNYLFVHGNSNPTFDSRYKEFGLISESQIFGKAYPITNIINGGSLPPPSPARDF